MRDLKDGSNVIRPCRNFHDHRATRDFEPLMTPAEASAYMRVHTKTIVRLARNEEIPALRIGRHWRFRQSDLIEWTSTRIKSARQPEE